MTLKGGPLLAGICSEEHSPNDRRRARRRTLLLEVATVSAGDPASALVHDLSETGLLLETSAELGIGEVLHVELPEAGPTKALIVWRSGRRFGCEFVQPVPKAAVSAALLRSPRASPSQAVDSDQSAQPSGRPAVTSARGRMLAAFCLALAAAALAVGGPTMLATVGAVAALLLAWGVWVQNNSPL